MVRVVLVSMCLFMAGCSGGRSPSPGPMCRTGCPCGRSCISCDYVCRMGAPAELRVSVDARRNAARLRKCGLRSIAARRLTPKGARSTSDFGGRPIRDTVAEAMSERTRGPVAD